jgi:membrane protein implicated in regulation of membrane protease activity
MQKTRRYIEAIFVLTLATLLLGGVLFVIGQAAALVLGQGSWLEFLNETVKAPMCIAASICAIAGFLLSYQRHDQKHKETPQEAAKR